MRAAASIAAFVGLVLCVLATWLALPRRVGEPAGTPLHAVLVDLSASVTRTRPNVSRAVARALREAAARAVREDAELLVVTYARGAERAYGPAPAPALLDRLEGRDPRPFVPVAQDDLGSDLEAALAVVMHVRDAPERRDARPGRVLICSDAEFTGLDPGPRLAALARDGMELAWELAPPRDVGDLSVVRLMAPGRLESGAALVVALELALRPGALGQDVDAFALVTVAGPGGPLAKSFPVTSPTTQGGAPDTSGLVRWSERFDLGVRADGVHTIDVRCTLRDARSGARIDPVPENDAARSSVRVGDAIVVCAVASEEDAPALRALFASSAFEPGGLFDGIQVVWSEPETLVGTLAGADLLATFDLPLADLPGPQLAAFVRAGGGWLTTAGWRFLVGWERPADVPEASSTRPADLLPLLPPREDERPRDVVLVVDGSGSMTGEPFDRVRRALFELVPAVRRTDRVELRFFTQTLGAPAFRSTGMTIAERRAALAPLLEAKVPGGGTDIAYALGRLAEERMATEVPGLCLLLTDGHSRTPGIGYGSVREQLALSGTDLAILAIGDRPNRRVLDSLLLEGEEVVDAGDLSGLAQLLHREVHRERVDSDPGARALLLDPARAAAGSLAREILSAQQPSPADAAGGPSDLGPLPAVVRARLAPGADLLWVSAAGAPLLALQAVGQGYVACLASAPREAWAPFLRTDPALLEPLLRALGRTASLARSAASGSRRPPLRLEREGGRLLLNGIPAGWPAELSLVVFPPRQRGGVGQLERGEPAGELTLSIGPGGTGLDPRTSREGPRPRWLDPFPSGTGLEVEVRSAGGVLAGLTYVTGAPDELDSAVAFVDRAAGQARPVAGRSRNEAPDPRAPWLLGAGLALLGLGALERAIPVKESGLSVEG